MTKYVFVTGGVGLPWGKVSRVRLSQPPLTMLAGLPDIETEILHVAVVYPSHAAF
jgi:hypothetical protein